MEFFSSWYVINILQCLKESYVKALGVGIGFSLQRLSFHVTDTQLYKEKFTRSTLLYVDGCLLTNWEFEETMLDDNHCVAVSMGPAINKEACIVFLWYNNLTKV